MPIPMISKQMAARLGNQWEAVRQKRLSVVERRFKGHYEDLAGMAFCLLRKEGVSDPGEQAQRLQEIAAHFHEVSIKTLSKERHHEST